MNRRDFIAGITLASASLALSGCNEGNRQAIDHTKQPKTKSDDVKSFNINKNRKTSIKLATSWPAHFSIIGTGVESFAKRVKDISSGSLDIKLYPKNTLVPALAVFDACSSGQIDAFHSGPYYWKGKNSSFSLIGGMPFGFTAEEVNSWMFYGEGLKLWREEYAKYNLYPFLGGNTNVQMGGWFRKPIKSLKDIEGLKIRMPGLAGEVFAKMGANPVLLPAGEIYTALERGVIDAVEWVGPSLDLKMDFYKVAPYYYSGWQEPGSTLELTFNKYFWENISFEHQMMLEVASSELNSSIAHEFHSQNVAALAKLKELKIDIYRFPDSVTTAAKVAFKEVIYKESQKSQSFKKIYDSMQNYLELSREWSDVSLRYFLNER